MTDRPENTSSYRGITNTMSDQPQSGPVIPMEAAALEFSNAFSLTIAKLVTEKLELKELNNQLIARVTEQQKIIEQLKREVSLVNSTPKSIDK